MECTFSIRKFRLGILVYLWRNPVFPRKFLSGRQNYSFHLHSIRNFRIVWVSGKQPLTDVTVDMTICIMLNRPFTQSGHMVQNQTYWDACCTVGLPKQRNSYQSTLNCLWFGSPTVQPASQYVWFTRDRIVQRACWLQTFKALAKLSYWWNVELFGCNIEGHIGFQRPPNFWSAKTLKSPCILCEMQKPNILIFVARSMTEALMPMTPNWKLGF